MDKYTESHRKHIIRFYGIEVANEAEIMAQLMKENGLHCLIDESNAPLEEQIVWFQHQLNDVGLQITRIRPTETKKWRPLPKYR